MYFLRSENHQIYFSLIVSYKAEYLLNFHNILNYPSSAMNSSAQWWFMHVNGAHGKIENFHTPLVRYGLMWLVRKHFSPSVMSNQIPCNQEIKKKRWVVNKYFLLMIPIFYFSNPSSIGWELTSLQRHSSEYFSSTCLRHRLRSRTLLL